MVTPKDQSMLSKLSDFSLGLKKYEAYRIILANKGLKQQEYREMMSLRERLVREVGKFSSLVTELTGKEKIQVVGKGSEYSYDMWSAALTIKFDSRSLHALRTSIDYTDRAIGKLESDIEAGVRDKQGNVIEKPQRIDIEPPIRISEDSGGRKMSTRKKALELLKECLGEIAKLRGRGYAAPEFGLWYDKVKAILEGAFTQADCQKFLHSWPTYNGLSSYASQKEYRKFLKKCETDLKWIIQKYEIRDKLSSEGERTLSLQLFNAMQFHPKVIQVSESLFKTGNYASAILEAFKAVNNFVKEKSGLSPNELRGMKDRPLMAKVFDEKEPLIKLNELITDTDINEQEGFKLLFMGATEGIRNPKAHDLIEMKDPYKTLEYLAFASLLLKKISFWKVD